MSDRREGPPGDGDLPPDPWAGLAEPSSIPPPTGQRGWDDQITGGDGQAAAERRRHPSSGGWHPSDPEPGPVPSSSRSSIWHHPVVWVVITLLALVALVGAVLDRPAPTSPEPSPASLDAAPWSAVEDPPLV